MNSTDIAHSQSIVGAFEVTVIQDGDRLMPLAEDFIKNADAAEAAAALDDAGYPEGKLPLFFNPTLLRRGDEVILVDVGNGESAAVQSEGKVGRLAKGLEAVGVAPGDVTTVILTHLHIDHYAGLLTADGNAAFPNARILLPAGEQAFWSDTTRRENAVGPAKANFDGVARLFDRLSSQISTYAADEEVLPGVTAIPTPGHTPSHMSLRLISNGEELLILGDVVNLPELFVRHPGWHARFDMDGARAEETRRKVLGEVADRNIPVIGYHFPKPKVAIISRAGDAYDYRYLET